MLPTDSQYGGWAASGEIDILEVFSRDPGPFAQAALHYGMASPLNTFDYARHSGVDPADGPSTSAGCGACSHSNRRASRTSR